MSTTHDSQPIRRSLGASRTTQVLLVFAMVAGVLLALEHRVHLLEALPWLILLLCPLMHLFMHHGHGHRHGAGQGRDSDAS